MGGAGYIGSHLCEILSIDKSNKNNIIRWLFKWFGINYAITYFYNVFGGREVSSGKYATLIALFVEKYKNGQPLTFVSPGKQMRNFTYIDDIINGIVLVSEKGYGDNFGIGCIKAYSVLEIANLFGSEIEMIPERKGNRMSANVVCQKTINLGWREKHSVEEYIKNIKNKN